jgi:hypothetical protein
MSRRIVPSGCDRTEEPKPVSGVTLARAEDRPDVASANMTRDGHLQDPGWSPAVKTSLTVILMPWRATRLSHLVASQAPVLTQRTLFVAFLAALGLLLVVLVVLFPPGTGDPGAAPDALGMLALGLVGLLGAAWVRQRRLTCGESDAVTGQWRTLSFLGIAFAETPALLGFIATFLAEALWPYLVGLAFSSVAFTLIAPTRSEIARQDERLARTGCPTSLRAALYGATDSAPDA